MLEDFNVKIITYYLNLDFLYKILSSVRRFRIANGVDFIPYGDSEGGLPGKRNIEATMLDRIFFTNIYRRSEDEWTATYLKESGTN